MALRELALRFLADETEEELLEHLNAHHTGVLWETSERILVGVTAAPGTNAIVRRGLPNGNTDQGGASRLAHHLRRRQQRGDEKQLERLRQRTTDVGAHWNEIQAEDSTQALFEFARTHQITQIVVWLKCTKPLAGAEEWGLNSQEDIHVGCACRHRCAHHREA